MEIIALVWVLGLAAWLILPAIAESRVAANRQLCLANLTKIGQSLSKYMADNDNRWPYVAKLRTVPVGSKQTVWPTLPDVLLRYQPKEDASYHCPSDSRELSEDERTRIIGRSYYETEGISYEWWWGDARGGRRIGEESISKASGFGYGRPDQNLLSDFEPFHMGDRKGSINSLYADFIARSSRGEPGN